MANPQEERKKLGQIVAKAWSDESFKKRLLADPTATLKAEGVDVPAGVEVRAVENTDKLFHFVLPPKPKGELSAEDLDKVAGGEKVFGYPSGAYEGGLSGDDLVVLPDSK